MSTPTEKPTDQNGPLSPWGILALGLALALLGGLLIGVGESEDSDFATWLGYLAAGVGGTIAAVGIVGAGVLAALQYDRHKRS